MDKIEVGEIFSITDGNDEEQEVEVLATINLDGTDYAAVAFVEDLEEDTNEDMDIFFLKVDEEGDLAAIESDDEFTKVSEAFEAILEEES